MPRPCEPVMRFFMSSPMMYVQYSSAASSVCVCVCVCACVCKPTYNIYYSFVFFPVAPEISFSLCLGHSSQIHKWFAGLHATMYQANHDHICAASPGICVGMAEGKRGSRKL